MAEFSILLVDDDEGARETLRDILVDCGHRVWTAGDGESAIRLAGEHAFEVALLDYKLPDTNGVELFLKLRGQQPGLIGCLVTAYASLETEQSANEAGAERVFSKPLEVEQLLRMIMQAPWKNVLVVDDDQEFCQSLRDVLAQRGYRVDLAHTADQAIDELNRGDCRTALVDLRLGDQSGLDMLQSQALERRPPRILVMSGFREQLRDMAPQLDSLGVLRAVPKPIDVAALLEALC